MADRVTPAPGGGDTLSPDDELSLVELVNRVLDKGALISGEVTISVAGVDLIYLGLRLVVSSIESLDSRPESTPRDTA